jgi:carbonic anhydrase/acetyltransferase-like protein (isoleucine patch superfamily)
LISPDLWSATVDSTAWVAANATIVGSVTLGHESSVWYTAVVRGDGEPISIGSGSNLQDGSVVHTDPGFPVRIGNGVSIGHRTILHGCTVEDDVLVGMAAVLMNGVVVGHDSIIGAGAVLPEGLIVPPRSLVLGLPAKVRGEVTDEQVADIRKNAISYVGLASSHRRRER